MRGLDLEGIRGAYRAGSLTPQELIRDVYRRIAAGGLRPVWISLVSEEDSLARARALGPYREDLPLYGLPFAIKDNIDLAGHPTTAGCPDYAYTPERSATVVGLLMAAGAIPVGKTNLDQFATGLVGTRSPYGACSSVFDPAYISGGSSSGSAVAVASGLVSFSLGTDTAGSGRVPAAFNNIVGVKPTRGALSTAGVVPACRTLDCVSIFALTCADAARVYEIAANYDPSDPWSRPAGQKKAWPVNGVRFGVPRPEQLEFFGDGESARLFDAAIGNAESAGGRIVRFDYSPFRDAAGLLYSGPWVAERLAAIREFAGKHEESLYPVTAGIIRGAGRLSAVDAFEAAYRLAELRRAAESEWRGFDVMLLPTAATQYTHQAIAESPVQLNTNLGYYTNFVNLLDLAAVSIPAGMKESGLPFGVTLVGPAWSDAALSVLADALHRASPQAEVGARLAPLGALPALSAASRLSGYVPLAVCGAHLSGQPLNHQLTGAGAFLLESCRTAPEYKLYALAGAIPAKPGLVRTPGAGAAIEVEVWAVPETTFGSFVAAIPPPVAIGSCLLEDGRTVKSFVCEPWPVATAEDITELGGWRAYRARVLKL